MNLKDLLKDAYKEGMTLDDIETALEGINLPTDNSAELERLKNALSKSNSEASDLKKQLREKMTADELKEKEEAESREKLENDYKALLKKVTISEHKAKFLSCNPHGNNGGYGKRRAARYTDKERRGT